MRKWIWTCLAVLLLGTAAGCSADDKTEGGAPAPAAAASSAAADSPATAPSSDSSAIGGPAAASPTSESPVEASSPPASASGAPTVQALHLVLTLPDDWTTASGEESFVFQADGAVAGGLDGLGYSGSVEELLPNGATVESQAELPDMPVKTIEATVRLGEVGEDGEALTELHYYFFLEERQVVYDLHFVPDAVARERAAAIARTAVIR